MKVAKRKAVVFLLSDFLDENFLDSLKIANRKHDLVGIKIFDPYEEKLPDIGMLKVEDSETGVSFWIDTSNKHFLKQMNDSNLKKTNEFYKSTQKMGLDIVPVSTSEDYVEPLMKFFRKRGKR